ncbi:hypothetical protein HZH66_001064 [Vespula vulgaris]|uniref:Uncharacterized protein n=1 Tax=Vespula vulgaris TaxID=7454 RepID=A0A834KSJ7_VESVU|nr:hypothetical protein HZH66_001064 [Vespula vulgaris]
MIFARATSVMPSDEQPSSMRQIPIQRELSNGKIPLRVLPPISGIYQVLLDWLTLSSCEALSYRPSRIFVLDQAFWNALEECLRHDRRRKDGDLFARRSEDSENGTLLAWPGQSGRVHNYIGQYREMVAQQKKEKESRVYPCARPSTGKRKSTETRAIVSGSRCYFVNGTVIVHSLGPVGEVGGVRLPLQSLHGYGSVFMYSALTSPGGGSGQAGGGGGEVTLRLREPEDIPEEVLARLEDTATLSISLQGDAVLRLGAAAAVLSKEFSNVPFSIVSRSESMENIESNSYIRAEEIKEKNRAKEKIAVTKRLKV